MTANGDTSDALLRDTETLGLFDRQYVGRVAAVVAEVTTALRGLRDLPLPWRIDAINQARAILHAQSPFRLEPVDCVRWVPHGQVIANDYNPNTVAPPEMELLAHSIQTDGYTQPIVAFEREGMYEVVDGFHRNRVGREHPDVRVRLYGYLPLTVINAERRDRNDRIAATIRHNRARGKHQVQAMSDIVVELKRRNWSDEKIGKELGMDPDEVLRLTQITGLTELFTDHEFSRSWDLDDGPPVEMESTEEADDEAGDA